MKLERTITPALEPVTLADAKDHLRVDGADDDTLITSLIAATRDVCETFLDRALIQQTWKLTLDSWPPACPEPWRDGVREGAVADFTKIARHIELPKGLMALTSIQTFDEAGAPTVFAATNYFVSSGKHGRVVLKSGVAWPKPGRIADGIEITFTAGFGAAVTDVPQSVRAGLLMLIAYLYENRGDDPMDAAWATGVTALWRPHARVRL
ncbi:MAG: head-tail connector protein [Sphingomonadales bacterium]